MKVDESNRPRGKKQHKILCLVRHGKAMPKDVGLSDFERTLEEEGTRECNHTAALLAERGLIFDLLISSPADRALETAHIFADRLDYPMLKITVSEKFYEAELLSTLTEYIESLDDEFSTVAIFGHNPAFDMLVSHYTPERTRSMQTGAVAGIEFDSESWSGTGKSRGKLAFWITPTSKSSVPSKTT